MLSRLSFCAALSALPLAACGSQAPLPKGAPGTPLGALGSPAAIGSAERDQSRAVCELRGTTRMWAGQSLFAEASAGPPVVEFTGEPVDIEVLGFSREARGRTPVVLHTAGFALRGFLASGDLDLFVRHEIPVLADTVFIEAGAHVRVLEGGPSGAKVVADDSDFAGVSARLDCDALTLQAPSESARAPDLGRPFHLRRRQVRIFSSPGGAPLDKLSARLGTTVDVVAEEGGFARVDYRRGVRVLGWMRRDDLAPGEGPDCDDCFGPGVRDSMDRCPDDPHPERADDTGCPDEGPAPAVVALANDTPIYLEPSRDSPSVGVGKQGTEVYVHKRHGSWARVHAKGWSVITPSGGGLWIEL